MAVPVSIVHADEALTVHHGHALDVLRTLPAGSVHMVVTSPPYWGLRDYGIPPTVWGGELEHEHAWQHVTKQAGGTYKGKNRWQHQANGRGEEQPGERRQQLGIVDGHPEIPAGAFCECGAWLGSLGLEPTPDLFVENIVALFREVRRVLRDDGTVWLNLGDSYASHDPGDRRGGEFLNPDGKQYDKGRRSGPAVRNRAGSYGPAFGLKAKDLIGIPWMVAFALRADGWYLRRDIVWNKSNPMPESVEDRPISAHEYLFLLSKSRRYFYDDDAVREVALTEGEAKWDPGTNGISGSTRKAGRSTRRFKTPAGWDTDPETRHDGVPTGRHLKQDAGQQLSGGDRMTGFNERWERQRNVGDRPRRPDGRDDGLTRMPGGEKEWAERGRPGRHLRSVWTIATQPYPGAHFATFPTKLVEPCILAGTSAKGVCPSCGAPWIRVTEVEYRLSPVHGNGSTTGQKRDVRNGKPSNVTGGAGMPRLNRLVHDAGWRPSCRHGGEPDDLELILTPVGEGHGGEYHRARLTTARRGLDRQRLADQGVRPMFRWQQRAIARQLKDSPHREAMAAEAGTAFDHYTRTDRTGARAVPPELLERWIEQGWITWPEEDPVPSLVPEPAVVLDPFAGSGTVGLVARELGRRAVLIDLNTDYLRQAIVRATRGLVDPGGHDVPEGSLWSLA